MKIDNHPILVFSPYFIELKKSFKLCIRLKTNQTILFNGFCVFRCWKMEKSLKWINVVCMLNQHCWFSSNAHFSEKCEFPQLSTHINNWSSYWFDCYRFPVRVFTLTYKVWINWWLNRMCTFNKGFSLANSKWPQQLLFFFQFTPFFHHPHFNGICFQFIQL